MLAWTTAGAVARPRTLQIRAQPAWGDRVAGRAPMPTRGLEFAEVADNLRWFTAAGPRVTPVDALVLTGEGVGSRGDLPAILELARERGIRRVTLHVGPADLAARPVLPGVDRLVLPVRLGSTDPEVVATAFARARDAGVPVDANVLLADPLARVPEAAVLAMEGCAASVTFTYPFPSSVAADPPPVADAVAALFAALPEIEGSGLPVSVKGVPACWLGVAGRLARRSANRWYVDAEHQKEAAILFFPGVVAFAKADACRFCAADAGCDGFVPAWASREGAPAVRAL